LPEGALTEIDWDSVSDKRLARFIWDSGVSIDALCYRLGNVLGQVPECVGGWAGSTTQRLLRRHLATDSSHDEITVRMDAAAQRRFPVRLQEAHLRRVAAGAIGRETLAWMLGIAPAALEVDSPQVPEVDADDLASALGL
jgi:hypothetical protein